MIIFEIDGVWVSLGPEIQGYKAWKEQLSLSPMAFIARGYWYLARISMEILFASYHPTKLPHVTSHSEQGSERKRGSGGWAERTW